MSIDLKRTTSTLSSTTKVFNISQTRPNSATRSNIIPLSSLSLKSVWLYDWWLVKPEGSGGLAVAGFTSRDELGRRLFCSAEIFKRHETTILETNDGIVVTLSGFIDRGRTRENGFSFQICDCFQLGFPFSWKEFATKFHSEECTSRGDPKGKSGFCEPNISSGTSTNTPMSFDDLSVTMIRDILMQTHGDNEDCALADILEQCCGDSIKCTPISAGSDSKNESPELAENPVLNETSRDHKRTKIDQKHKDEDKIPHAVDTVMRECISPSRGVITRSMSRSRKCGELEEQDFSSNSTLLGRNFRNNPEKILGLAAPSSDAAKNQSGGKMTGSTLEDRLASPTREVKKASDGSVVRRSSNRLNIRKNYSGMDG